LFENNIGLKLSIDEVSLSNGELYTVLTNKKAKGKKGSLAAIVKGTKFNEIQCILSKIPIKTRNIVTEITLDMSPTMAAISRNLFPNAILVTDRFHVQQVISGAVQEVRIDIRKKIIKEENEKWKQAKENKTRYVPSLYNNGDTRKQLLARSRHLLFKPKSKWSDRQLERSQILFNEYPVLKKMYDLSMYFRSCYENSKSIPVAKEKFNKWYFKVKSYYEKEPQLDSMMIAADTLVKHKKTILNYFINRSTNAGAESFNAKLKGFRAVVRGVSDKKFFLFRIAKLYG
jgi:transposase